MPAPMTAVAPTAADTMALFEALIERGNPSLVAGAKPVRFVFANEEWSFDPSRTGDRFAPFTCSSATLAVHTSPPVLHRLLTAPNFYLRPGEHLYFKGDVAALTPLIGALEAKR